MILLADCGNSALKTARCDSHGRLSGRRRLDAPPTTLAATLDAAGMGEGAEALVLLPGNQARADVVAAWWRRCAGGRPLRRAGDGLPLPDLGQYPGCGADRVLAGWAAVRTHARDLVVIDAGTATTLGAWRRVDGAARFLGGLILPGAHACLAGLAAQAPALPVVEPGDVDDDPLQRDTCVAISAAIGIGYPALVRACADRLGAATGIAARCLTGGDATRLAEDLGVTPEPDLVLHGLALLATGA